MSEVFKISLPGNAVRDADLKNEAIDSRYASPKISTVATPPHAGIIYLNWQSTTLSYPERTTKVLYSFQHNYATIPTVFASYKFDNGTQHIYGTLPLQIGSLGLIILDTDKTYVNLKYFSLDIANTTPIPPFALKIRFYVMAEAGY